MASNKKHPKFRIGTVETKNPFKAIYAAFSEHYVSFYKKHLTDIFIQAYKAEGYNKLNVLEAKTMENNIITLIEIAYYIQDKKITESNYVQRNFRMLDSIYKENKDLINRWESRIQILDQENFEKPFEYFESVFKIWSLKKLKKHISSIIYYAINDHDEDQFFDFNIIKFYKSVIGIIEACYIIYYKKIVDYDFPNNYLHPKIISKSALNN